MFRNFKEISKGVFLSSEEFLWIQRDPSNPQDWIMISNVTDDELDDYWKYLINKNKPKVGDEALMHELIEIYYSEVWKKILKRDLSWSGIVDHIQGNYDDGVVFLREVIKGIVETEAEILELEKKQQELKSNLSSLRGAVEKVNQHIGTRLPISILEGDIVTKLDTNWNIETTKIL